MAAPRLHEEPGGDGAPTMGEIGRSLGRLEAKIDRSLEDHEQRLRRTERWVYALPPTLIASLVSLAIALLSSRS